jgi:hypothetical protein
MRLSSVDQNLLPQQTRQLQTWSRVAFLGCGLLLVGITVSCAKRHWAAALPSLVGAGLLLKGGWSYHHWNRDAQQVMRQMANRTAPEWDLAMLNAARNAEWDQFAAMANRRWPIFSQRVDEELLLTQQAIDQRIFIPQGHLRRLAQGLGRGDLTVARTTLLMRIIQDPRLGSAGPNSIGLQLWRHLCEQAVATALNSEEAALSRLIADETNWPGDSPVIVEILRYCLNEHLPKLRTQTRQLADRLNALLPVTR